MLLPYAPRSLPPPGFHAYPCPLQPHLVDNDGLKGDALVLQRAGQPAVRKGEAVESGPKTRTVVIRGDNKREGRRLGLETVRCAGKAT